MNMNPKTAHFLLEVGQIAGYISAAASIPGIGTLSPYIGLAAGAAGLYLGWLKANKIGNITPTS
jgi:hypothetical protein